MWLELASAELQISRGLRIIIDNYSYFSMKTYVMTAHENGLGKTVLMKGHNIYFKGVIWIIIPLSLLIWSTGLSIE